MLQSCNDDDNINDDDDNDDDLDYDALCYKTQLETLSPVWTFAQTLTNNFVNVVRLLFQGIQI